MKMKLNFLNHEKGQVLPIVVISTLVMIMLAALMIDGGMLLSHRRTAQAAADAGALAGARKLCPGGGGAGAATTAATDFVTRNNAQVEGISFPQANAIHVETSVSSQAFFAGIFGQLGLTANAIAEAACTPPSGASVLPIGFPCYPEEYYIDPVTGEPVPNSGPTSENETCFIRYGDESQDIPWHILEKRMVIVMDSKQITDGTIENPYCYPDGFINCDLTDGETMSVLISDSNRGWLSLDGSGGANSMCGFIYPGDSNLLITKGTWLSGNTGYVSSLWTQPNCLKKIVGEKVIIPIFNEWCRGHDPEFDCPLKWQTGDTKLLGNGLDLMYRIESFGIFKVTCIEGSNTKPADACPYRKYLVDMGIIKFDKPNALNSVSSIEGYFLKGIVSDGMGLGIDTGTYTVTLTK
jgi:hypothetical protein